MSGVRMLHFWKDWWQFIQIHQYYTMALIRSTLAHLYPEMTDFDVMDFRLCLSSFPS